MRCLQLLREMIQAPPSPTSVCDPLSCDPANRRKLPTAHAHERCTFRPAVGEGHSTGEPNERMENIERSQGGDLVWPTKEELFREPPAPQECDICSLPMGNSAKPGIDGSAAFTLVSRCPVLRAAMYSVQPLTQCLPVLPKVLLRKADLPRMSLLELDGARETMLSILSRTIPMHGC